MSSIMRIKNDQGEWTSVVSLKGEGVQPGGVTGQYLVKKSNDDFDTEWQTPSGVGDMRESVYDPQGKNTDILGYVDGKVKTDVPENAKFTDTTYENATTSVSGLMSNSDKSKLDGVAAGATKLALGETSATAYRGDRGKIAYDHSQATHAPSNAQKNSDITKAEIEAKLTGAITTHTHDYVPTNSFKGSTFTANVIPLDNPLGSFRVATASNVATYTLSTTKVTGAWAKILVNRATAPTVTGGTLIKGSDFKPSTNMYLYVSYDGTKSEYYFAEI